MAKGKELTPTPKVKSKAGGHNKHIPTDKIRATVAALNSYGITLSEISLYTNLDDKTLRKYYSYELDTSHVKANTAVARKLYKKGVEDGDTTALIFWLKTRAQWREPDKKEIRQENAQILEEIKDLRAQLNEKNKKDY